jgi:hypothetical protein
MLAEAILFALLAGEWVVGESTTVDVPGVLGRRLWLASCVSRRS